MKHVSPLLIFLLLAAVSVMPNLTADDSKATGPASEPEIAVTRADVVSPSDASPSASVARIRTKSDDEQDPTNIWGAVVPGDAVPNEDGYIAVPHQSDGVRFQSVEEETKHLQQMYDGADVTIGKWMGSVRFVDYEPLLGLALLQVDSPDAKLPALKLSETWPTEGQVVDIHHGPKKQTGRLTLVHRNDHLPWQITLTDGSEPEMGAPVTSEDGRLLGLVRTSSLRKQISQANANDADGPVPSYGNLLPADFLKAIVNVQHPGVTDELADVIVGQALGVNSAQFRSRADSSTPESDANATYDGTSPDQATYASNTPRNDIKVFQLENVSAEEALTTLGELFHEKVTLSQMPSQRMIIARGSREDLAIIEALLLRLDTQSSVDASEPQKPSENADASGWFSGDARLSKHVREGRHLSLQGLRAQFEDREAKSRQLAESKRRSINEDGVGIVVTEDLRMAVTEAFDARQMLQRRQLAELTERMASLERSLEARDGRKDQIIDRRVDELLHPATETDKPHDSPDSRNGVQNGEDSKSSADTRDGVPLATAIAEFNRNAANDPIGKEQPPLTEEEVVAAIRFWKFKRDEAPVPDEHFAEFQRIVQTRWLPPGWRFHSISKFTHHEGEVVDAWSVRLGTKYEWLDRKPGYQFVIREQLVDSHTVDPESLPQPYIPKEEPNSSDALNE